MQLDNYLSSINEKFELISELVEGVSLGALNGLAVSGPPGIGKTYTVMNVVDRVKGNKKFVAYSGHVTPLSLYNILAENRDDAIIVFDDCDEVFTNHLALNILKPAMDTKKTRIVSWATSQSNRVSDPVFTFKSNVILVTNTVLATSPHYKAFVDRIHHVELDVSYEERLAKIYDIVNTSKTVEPQLAREVAEYLIDEKPADELSLRTFVKIYDLARFSPRWRKLVKFMNS
jgi:Cdc6-like AAA superfamily ATPase